MNRRELFALLAGAVAAPSELIVPERTIFLPPAGGWPVRPRWGEKRYAATLSSYWLVMARPQDFYGPDNPHPSWMEA